MDDSSAYPPDFGSSKTNVLESIDEVFEEVFYFWHQCSSCYHDPVSFRANLNALIQSMRNITFRLQAIKSLIPGFDEWYEPWREFFRNHPFISWINEARINIVKRKGLESKSLAIAKVFYSYQSPLVVKLEVPPRMMTDMIVSLVSSKIPSDIRGMCIVEVFRKWVIDDFPDQEILTVLSECFRIFLALRSSLKELLSGNPTPFPDLFVSRQSPVPCMFRYQVLPLRVNPATGEFYHLKKSLIEYNPLFAEEAIKHYGINMKMPDSADKEDALTVAELLVPISMAVMERDGYHIPLLHLHSKEKGWTIQTLMPAERLEKYFLWHHVAEQVQENNFDALIFISEAWMVPLDSVPLEPYPKITESKEKKEILQIYAEDCSGRVLNIIIPFTRCNNKIIFGEIVRDNNPAVFTDPVRKVWASVRG